MKNVCVLHMDVSRFHSLSFRDMKVFCLFQGQAVFPLYSAGVCVAGNCRSCPYTYRTLLSLRTFISSNSLGSAGFWLLGPGATLGSCYGPTNTRLRCHLGKTFSRHSETAHNIAHILKKDNAINNVFKIIKSFPVFVLTYSTQRMILLCQLRE